MRPALALGQAEFAAALLDPDRPCPPGLRAWNGSDPAVRLAVHRNNVMASLIDALGESFPVVQQLVGEDFFRAMAGLFVRRSPPRSRVLALYGQDLPRFIADFEPARSLPYLADVARLEAARVRACHAAEAQPLAPHAVALALSSGERAGGLRLVCHPSLASIASAHAVVSLWAAHQHDEGIEAALQGVDVDAPENALVLRQGLDVLVLRAPEGAAAFVAALLEGASLSDAAAAATDRAPAFELAATLRLLLAHGALSSIELPPRPHP